MLKSKDFIQSYHLDMFIDTRPQKNLKKTNFSDFFTVFVHTKLLKLGQFFEKSLKNYFLSEY